MDAFEMLRGCRIVEGFVNIVLIEHFKHNDSRNFTFPELVEITEYLLIYHVTGLRTLSTLFPNLRVIRGKKLITDFALIVYENSNMLEVGLPSLTHIMRGGVRIVKNPLLCFGDSINWTAISNEYNSFTEGNKKRNECPLCPSGRTAETSGAEHVAVHERSCPASPADPQLRLCWNMDNCQHVCNATACGAGVACSANGTCCAPGCAGGCPDGRPDECYACKHLRLYNDTTNTWRCVDKCPPGLYDYSGVRCVSYGECQNVSKAFSTTPTDLHMYPYAPIMGLCTDQCPAEHEREDDASGKRVCRPCNGKCRKPCMAATVDSIATAQHFRGCNVVRGDLTIHIRSQGARKYMRM